MKSVYYYKSPIGPLRIESENDAITALDFAQRTGRSTMPVPSCIEHCVRQLNEYFNGERQEFDLELNPQGTPFQRRVWRELQKINYGKTLCYGDIAKRIKNPKGARAVGMANNRNPIAIIIPCHRVIGADGKMVGYASGVEKKDFLLRLEGVRL